MKTEEIGLGYIYFLGSRNSPLIKIGFSRDPVQRRFDIEMGSPIDLMLLAFMPGTRKLERELHRMWKKYRVRGEWFNPDPEIWDWMNRLRFDPKSLQHFGNPDPLRYLLIERQEIIDVLGEENYWKLKRRRTG